MSRFFLVLLISLPTSLFAMDEPTNFCLDKQASINNDVIAARKPNDPRIIRLVALRTGLCNLLAKRIIDLEFAIDLFNQMQSSSITEQVDENIRDGQSYEGDFIAMWSLSGKKYKSQL